jgi:hypothetical protein
MRGFAATAKRLRDDRVLRTVLTLDDPTHQFADIPTTFGKHLRSDRVNLRNDRIVEDRLRHHQKTPRA